MVNWHDYIYPVHSEKRVKEYYDAGYYLFVLPGNIASILPTTYVGIYNKSCCSVGRNKFDYFIIVEIDPEDRICWGEKV